MTPDLLAAWRAAVGDGAPADAATAAGNDLIERWSEPQRHYHTLDHLRRMLSIVDAHAGAADDPDAVRLAAWLHDAVYDPTALDNEHRSAELAARMLPPLGIAPDRVAEVVRLVWLTATHRVDPGDRDGALLSDADLAILAAPATDYAAYRLAVRQEYGHVPDDLFRTGRAAILRQLLAAPALFHLPELRDAWEAPARANIATEIAALS